MATDQDVLATIRDAVRLVSEGEVPDDLRRSAFEKAFEALTASSGSDDTAGLAPAGGADRIAGAGTLGGSALDKAASKIGVDAGLLERVLDFDDEGVHIVVQRSRLPRQKSAAIQQVATLIVGGRQAAGLDSEWTLQAHVRHATEEMGVDDHSNFASHMKKLVGLRARGSGKTGELKMNAVGFEALAKLVTELAGDDV